jgi:hypothetical protein
MRTHALTLWEQHSSLCFDREETLCLMHGIVISLPHLYLMAIPVYTHMTDDQIYANAHLRNPLITDHFPLTTSHPVHPRPLPQPDMLHIVHAVGRLADFRTLYIITPALQYRYLCFHRWRGPFRRIPTHKIFP